MFHLGMIAFPTMTHVSGTWRREEYPFDRTGFDRPDLWVAAAASCEEAGYDFTFAADTEGIQASYKDSPGPALKAGYCVPAFDQGVLADFIAARTKNIGTVSTMATSAIPPYLLARRLASMDHLSEGRTAWNIVTGVGVGGLRGLGIEEMTDHDERYDRADEFLALCRELWDGWAEDAVALDAERNVFIDPAKVEDLNFEGRWFRSLAPLNVHRSPQGGPLLCQAGMSPKGIGFAAKWAELVFSIRPTPESMRDYHQTVKNAVDEAGRDPDSCKVMFAIHAFVGESEQEAEEKRDRHHEAIEPEKGLIMLSHQIGMDLSVIDPYTPLDQVEVPGSQGLIAAWRGQGHGTLADVASDVVSGTGPALVGTPEQIADELAEMMEFVGGDGIMVEPLYIPYDLYEFNQKVVPILQQRGLCRTEYTGATLRENLLAF